MVYFLAYYGCILHNEANISAESSSCFSLLIMICVDLRLLLNFGRQKKRYSLLQPKEKILVLCAVIGVNRAHSMLDTSPFCLKVKSIHTIIFFCFFECRNS